MNPIFLELGPLTIRYYGLMYALGFILSLWLIKRDLVLKQIKIDLDQLYSLATNIFFFGLLGGRLYYILFNFSYYFQNPFEVIAIWHGGMAIHGGIAGGILAGYYLCKKYSINPLQFGDLVAPYLLMSQALGRFGNFMNGDAHGIPTDLPWGVTFPIGTPAGNEFPYTPTHPVMLYELILNALFALILYRLRLKPFKDGFLFNLYFIAYGISRFICTFFRADSLMLGPLKMAHVVSFLFILTPIFIIATKKLYQR